MTKKTDQKTTTKSVNKPTNKSWLITRLKDCGYPVDRLDTLEYQESDNRKFSILLDHGVSSIIITCYKDRTFHYYDGNRLFPIRNKYITESVEVIIENLHEKGVINKHWTYADKNTAIREYNQQRLGIIVK